MQRPETLSWSAESCCFNLPFVDQQAKIRAKTAIPFKCGLYKLIRRGRIEISDGEEKPYLSELEPSQLSGNMDRIRDDPKVTFGLLKAGVSTAESCVRKPLFFISSLSLYLFLFLDSQLPGCLLIFVYSFRISVLSLLLLLLGELSFGGAEDLGLVLRGGSVMGSIPPELSLDLGPSYVPKTITDFLSGISTIGDVPDRVVKLDEFLKRLEEEMRKIDAFKRELPLCMILLGDGWFGFIFSSTPFEFDDNCLILDVGCCFCHHFRHWVFNLGACSFLEMGFG